MNATDLAHVSNGILKRLLEVRVVLLIAATPQYGDVILGRYIPRGVARNLAAFFANRFVATYLNRRFEGGYVNVFYPRVVFLSLRKIGRVIVMRGFDRRAMTTVPHRNVRIVREFISATGLVTCRRTTYIFQRTFRLPMDPISRTLYRDRHLHVTNVCVLIGRTKASFVRNMPEDPRTSTLSVPICRALKVDTRVTISPYLLRFQRANRRAVPLRLRGLASY